MRTTTEGEINKTLSTIIKVLYHSGILAILAGHESTFCPCVCVCVFRADRPWTRLQ